MSQNTTPGCWKVDTSIIYEVSVVSPWSAENSPANSAVYGDYRGGIICTANWNTGVPTKAQAIANLRLISAASELLESLQEVLTDIGIDPDGSPEGCSRMVKKALAAIQKAKGGRL